MRRRLAVIGILLALGCTACANASPAASEKVPSEAPTGFISHHGRWLTDSEGRVLLPHGINYVVKQPPFNPLNGFNAADASFLADHGFRAVRLGVLFDA